MAETKTSKHVKLYGWCMDGHCENCPEQNFKNKPCEHECHKKGETNDSTG